MKGISIGDIAGRLVPRGGYYYLATPYSKYAGGIGKAFEDACALAARLVRAGVPVFSPIAHTHPIAEYGSIDPLDHNIWLPVDAPFMHNAHALIVALMPGWDESKGVAIEAAEFERTGKPIYYLAMP